MNKITIKTFVLLLTLTLSVGNATAMYHKHNSRSNRTKELEQDILELSDADFGKLCKWVDAVSYERIERFHFNETWYTQDNLTILYDAIDAVTEPTLDDAINAVTKPDPTRKHGKFPQQSWGTLFGDRIKTLLPGRIVDHALGVIIETGKSWYNWSQS